MSDCCGGDAEMMEGKDISRDLGYHAAFAERRFLDTGIHQVVIETPGTYMVSPLDEKSLQSAGAILYRTDRRPHEPATMQCFAVHGGMPK